MEYFERPSRAPRSTGARPRARRSRMLDARRGAGRRDGGRAGAGRVGILLHEAVGHGLEADFNRKQHVQLHRPDRQAGRVELCTVVDDGTHRQRARLDQRRRRGQPRPDATCSSRTASWSATCRTASRRDTSAPTPSGNGRRQSFRHEPLPRMTNTLLLAGHRRPRGDHPLGEARHLRQALLRRPGQHLERRLRLLADRELPDRGRQAHRAAQGREPDRQRPRRAAQGRHARQRLRAVRRHLDLRQGRPVRAGRRRHADGEDREITVGGTRTS